LGELADPIAVDLLLRIANDDQHALQETAAVAIGHMKNVRESEAIFSLLKRLSQSNGVIALRAVRGLRYFDTVEAWKLIRGFAADDTSFPRAVAIEQLQYNDDSATKDLLLEILAKREWMGCHLEAARKLFGMESLEPDYASLRNCSYPLYSESDCLRRVCEKGDPARIMTLIADDRWDGLAQSLISRDPLPFDVASKSLDSPYPSVVEVAAHLLGRSSDKGNAKPLVAALKKWSEHFFQVDAKPSSSSFPLEAIGNAVKRLIWAVGRFQVGKAEVIALLLAESEAIEFVPIRVTAARTIREFKLDSEDIAKLAPLMDDPDDEVRVSIGELMSREAKQIAIVMERGLSDRKLFLRLGTATTTKESEALLRSAAANPHHQSIVLTQLVKSADVKGLGLIAEDAKLDDLVRQGALEALGRIGNSSAASYIEKVGKSKENSEELRKMAWKVLRRSKRMLTVQGAANG
jgi:ParB family chromosome partitioning protein